jgi:hypothetical protein
MQKQKRAWHTIYNAIYVVVTLTAEALYIGATSAYIYYTVYTDGTTNPCAECPTDESHKKLLQ